MTSKHALQPLERIAKDRRVRVELARQSHRHFFAMYLSHYLEHPSAPFHDKIFSFIENEKLRLAVVCAFRGSGKSTLATLSYPLWAILGKQQRKFVLILSQTQTQARLHLINIKKEFETNPRLRNDFGIYAEESPEWSLGSLFIPRLGVRIFAGSVEQSIRGIRNMAYRPDLIICDDVEDIQSVRTREGRKKTYDWLTSEVLPAGDTRTKIIIVGNLLHEDSLIMRLRSEIKEGRRSGIFRAYPLLDGRGRCLWPGKYPTRAAIREAMRSIGDERAWQREYLLRILPDDDQVIFPEWIQYYDEFPVNEKDRQGYPIHTEVRIGVDLAISQKDTADYTAMVPARLYGEGSNTRIYILPNLINKRMSFPETVEMCKALHNAYYEAGKTRPTFIVEDVAYQRSLPQQLEAEGIRDVQAIRPGTQDKRTRLVLTSHLIKTGKVLFPRTGCEELIAQIVHFGVEKHDDLADAFSILVNGIYEDPPRVPRISIIGDDNPDDPYAGTRGWTKIF